MSNSHKQLVMTADAKKMLEATTCDMNQGDSCNIKNQLLLYNFN